MKNRITSKTLFFITAAAVASQVPLSGIGVGIMAGDPTGISIKSWINDKTAIDGGVGWSFSGEDSFQMHADYLFHNFEILETATMEGSLPLYYGIGGRYRYEEDDGGGDSVFGVRVPIGVSYIFPESPIDVFAEIVPILDLIPDTEIELNAAVGIRYYF